MEIGRELEALGLLLRQERGRYIEKYGLKSTQVQLILEIGRRPGVSQDELSELVGVDKSNVARQLAILEQMDYVERKIAPNNRRKLQLHLKDRGLRLLPRLQKAEENWEATLLQDLSHWEVSQLSSLLSRLRQAAQEQQEEMFNR